MPKVISLTGTLAYACKNRVAAVFGSNVSDKFLNENGLADACTAEETYLTAFSVRCKEVDYLDACFEDLLSRTLVTE